MYKYGGVYMDTDVELIKPIDDFLGFQAFSGFESSGLIPTGIMASEKGFGLFGELLDYYKDRHFRKEDGSLDTTTNVDIITNACKERGLVLNNRLQKIDGFVIYPSDVFCPKDVRTGQIRVTDNTVAIHHFAGSWLDGNQKKLKGLRDSLHDRCGYKIGELMYNTIFIPYRLYYLLKMYGIKKTMRKVIGK